MLCRPHNNRLCPISSTSSPYVATYMRHETVSSNFKHPTEGRTKTPWVVDHEYRSNPPMGQNNRRKNKWKKENAAGADLPRRRRWGSGSGTTAATDGTDGPEAYTKSMGRSRKNKASGKLRGRCHDDSGGDTTSENVFTLAEEGHTTEPDASKEDGRQKQAGHEKIEAGLPLELPTKTIHSSPPESRPAPHAGAGIFRGYLEERGEGPAHVHTNVDHQHNIKPQAQLNSQEARLTRLSAAVKEGQTSNKEETLARISPNGKLVDKPLDRLSTAVVAKDCNNTNDGGFNNNKNNVGLSPPSPHDTTAKRSSASGGVIVPALCLGNTRSEGGLCTGKSGRTGTAKIRVSDTPYSLAWADGQKGRQLMNSVEDLLTEWLRTQEAKGICMGEKISAIGAMTSSNFVPLGQLAEQLDMSDPVASALGLRLRGEEWEKLLEKIAAARDFLDLDAEAACRNALVAFGSQASAPRPTESVPINALASLARIEAAGLDLAELELRQALRAEASRIAPRSCPSAAPILFQGLDPDATGVITTADLACFASRLLGYCPESASEQAPRAADTRHTAVSLLSRTPRASTAATISESSGRRSSRARSSSSVGAAASRSTSSGEALNLVRGSSSSSALSRIRQVSSVIDRLARSAAAAAAAAAASSPAKEERKGACESDRHEEHMRVRRDHSDGIGTARGSEPQGQTTALVASPVTSLLCGDGAPAVRRLDDAWNGSGGSLITLPTFCRFIDGEKFDGKMSLEGFLRTLSRAGQLEAAAAVENGATPREKRATHNETYSSALTARRSVSSVENGSRGAVGTVRWGERGLRRASTQFAHYTLPAKHFASPAMMTSGGKRTAVQTQAHDGVVEPGFSRGAGAAATRRVGGGGSSSARSAGGGSQPSSRSGASTTARGAARAPAGAVPGSRGGGYVAQALSSFDATGSGTLSSGEFASAASEVAGFKIPVRQEWADVLTTKFAAAAHGGEAGRCVRWLAGSRDGRGQSKDDSRLDVVAFVNFLQPKQFSLSVMTPFGLVELSLEDACLTLGGLREIIVNKMFWRQHNCQVRRSDRDNFTLSRYYGAVPLDTESAGQRRRTVLDVLRPGELIFVTDRAASRGRQEASRKIPRFQYMMGAQKRQAAGVGTPGVDVHKRCCNLSSRPSSRQRSQDIIGSGATIRNGDEQRWEKARDTSVVFDWSADQVERWIGEAMELECCREAFRASQIDGVSLARLTQDELVEDLGVKNPFHARKIVLHLDRLVEESLGLHVVDQIPRTVPSWRSRHFLVWCWQSVGVRHRPTLAHLRQAGIDGLVLLAMKSDDWARLAATSPHPSCEAPLEKLRKASLALSSQLQIGSPALSGGDSAISELNDADESRGNV